MHGGSSGGGFGHEPVRIGTGTVLFLLGATLGLFTMPARWPLAFRKVLVFAVLSTGVSVLMPYASGLFLLWASWYIAHKYMTPTHYRPNPRKVAVQQQKNAALTKYDHLRGTTTWNNTLREGK